MMDKEREAEKIYKMNINSAEKIERFKKLLLDCRDEMDAQDQNMHPEIDHELSEAYRIALNYIRQLESS